MIEVTVQEFRNQATQYAVEKLKACTTFDPGYGYQIGIVVKELEDQFRKFEQEAHKKYAEIAEKNEDGSAKMQEHEFKGMKYSTYVFPEENKAVADDIAITSGQNKIVLQNRPHIYLSKLIGAKLNPVELVAIDFMIDDQK